MKKSLLLLTALIGIHYSWAQTEVNQFSELKAKNDKNSNIDTVYSVLSGNFSLGVNQGMLHNWAAGGEIVSATINAIFNGSYIKYMGRSLWTTNLDMAYGNFYAYSNEFEPRKTDDRIDLTSKYGYRILPKKDLYFTTLLNAKTQITNAYDYKLPDWEDHPISAAFSPFYLTLAPGIEYRRGSEFSVFFSPAAMRTTFVKQKFTESSPEGAFGVAHGKKFRFEIGAYLTARYTKAITKNLSYNGRFDAYSNYLAKNTYDNSNNLIKKDNPSNIDILWDNNFSYNFLKYFSINFGLLGIYDNDIPYTKNPDDPTKGLGWWQVKEYLNVGFNYKF